MQYEDMIVEASGGKLVTTADKRRLGRFNVRILPSPTWGMKAEEAAPVEYDDVALQASLLQLERRELDRVGLIALGRTLALLLLPPKKMGAETGVRDLLANCLSHLDADHGLRLRLQLPPQLAALPWEYMYVDRAGRGEGMDGFLALDPRVVIVRHTVLPLPAEVPPVTGDLKVVVALASAAGLPALDLAKERADLEQALGGQAGLVAKFLQDATLDEVGKAMPGTHVFHFAGHGKFTLDMGDEPGTYTGTGAVALFDQEVDAGQLGINLRGSGVRLAVLGACQSGRRDGMSEWSGVAPVLVKEEIPAVVANQYSILDKCAIAFSRHFYLSLVGGLGIEQAVARGRIAAYNVNPEGRDWGVPVLYLRGTPGRLFEGAADAGVRKQAQAAAELDINQRVKEVAAGGLVLGSEVGEMLDGKLAVKVTVDGTICGTVIGGDFGVISGGNVKVEEDANVVGPGGVLIGVRAKRVGGSQSDPAPAVAQPTTPGLQCPNCHQPVQAGWKCCAACGQPLPAAPRHCTHCGAELVAGREFCPGCGRKVT